MKDFDLPLSQDSLGNNPVLPLALAPPRVQGYEVRELIGQGGMGTVWRAVEVSTKRHVALKVLSLPLITDRARARFEREIELASRLSHPNIVRIYHSGLGEGFLYYSMELVEGVHLDQYVHDRQLNTPQILELFKNVCLAVHHAHQRGVLHRDLKPSNIVVSEDGQPHILDFGLAKAVEESAAQVTITKEGAVAGTLAYMAPEQAAGLVDQIDIRSDVYSLGVVLFHLLTRQWPHDTSLTQYQQQRAIVEGELRRPRQVNPEISRELETILLKTLEKQPARRYNSAGDLAEDLRRFLSNEVILARPLTGGYFLRKWVSKHRTRVLAGSIVLLLLVFLSVFAYVRISQEKTIALQQAETAREALYLQSIALAVSELQQGNFGAAQNALDQCLPEYRQWEWYRLRYLADQSIRTIANLPERTSAMTVCQKTQQIIGASTLRGLAYWDPADGKLIREIPLPGSPPEQIILSPDGQTLACIHADRMILRQGSTGVEIAQILIPNAHFAQWMYSGSGSHLAMFAKTDRLLQWDASTGRELSSQTITGADRLLALGDGGQALLKAGDQLKLVGVDGQVLTLPDSFKAGNDVMVRLETVGGQQALLYAMPGSPIQCWNIPEMTLRWELPWTVPDRGELHWNTVHQRLAYIDRQGVIYLWDIPTLSKMGTYQGHAGRPDFCWFEDGSSFVTILRHHELKIWQADRSKESQLVWTGNPGESFGVICGSENGTVAASIGSRKIGVWPAPHARPVELEIQTSNIKAHRLTPDGKAVVLATQDGTLALWDAATGQLQRSIVRTPSPATDILCDPQLRWIATFHSGAPGKTSIWSLEGQLLAELQVSPPLALNKDASLLIGCKYQGHGLVLINTQDWAVDDNHPLLSTNSRIFAMDAASQADRVVVAEQSGKVHLMDLAQRHVLWTLQPYGNQSVAVVALTPNGKRVAFSGSGRLTLWDTATGTMVMDLSPSATINISRAFFTRQGRQLVVRDRKQLRGWDIGQ